MEVIEEVCIKPDIQHMQLEIKIEREENESHDILCPKVELTEVNIQPVSDEKISIIKTEVTENIEIPESTPEIVGKVYENGKINRVKCPQCENTFKNRANLKRHITTVHSTDYSAECKECFRTFKSQAHLRCHVKSVHAIEEEISCEICQKKFMNKKKLYNHIFYSHPEPGDAVTCELCQKTFKKPYILKVHKRQVHESQTVKCDTCLKEFKNDMLLQRHIKWSHPADGMMYKCQQCGRILPSIACYRQHMDNVHALETNIRCEICQKTFKNNKSLQRHKLLHSGEQIVKKQYKLGDLQCPECDKKFANATNLTWHFDQNHSGNKPTNTCYACDKDFSDNACLRRHLESCHSEVPATCELCQKSFKSDYNLQRHIRITHAPPEAAETCEICKKTFKCAMHLRIHINAVHPKTGSFHCDICDKEFSSKKYMVKHRKTHVPTKDFPCPICDKYFKSVHCVTKHMRRVHKERELLLTKMTDNNFVSNV